jgi:protein-L-isoaspartate(D-aspartate) O-methyltransferase
MEFKYQRMKLVSQLKKEGRIKKLEIENAFLEIPRENFIPDNLHMFAYSDSPLEIGDRQTISAPHMVAIMCEDLDLKLGQKILEIGSGSGYHAAIVSKIIGQKGFIYSVERIESLADYAKKNLKKTGIKNVKIILGDGSQGLKENAPYDRIYATCCAPKFPPLLINQLKDNGKLMVPIGKNICSLKLLEKKQDDVIIRDLGGCAFVQMIGKNGH